MKYKGLQFTNKSEKVVEIDIEGYIGFDPYDSPENQINTKEKMKAELKKIANLKAETIIVNINSFGGDVNHAISIHDLLAENEAKVITKINGMIASSATIIVMAGDERKMSDNALFLVHNASSFGWGDKNDIKSLSEDLNTIDDRIANIYSKVTGKSKDEVLDLMNEDKGFGKWLTADEAKDFGFITDVFEPLKAVAYFSNDILSQYHLPTISNNPSDTQNSDISNNSLFQKIRDLFSNETKSKNATTNKTEMKKFELINKTLGVESLESTDEGIFLNEQQLDAIEAALKPAKEPAATDTPDLEAVNLSLDAIDETVASAEDTEAKIVAVNTLVSDLRKNAGAATAKVIKKVDDTKIKDAAVSKDDGEFMDNVDAVAEAYL